MTKNIPTFLYKYRECNERSFKNLKNNVVWCGTLNNYNDPYEGYTTISFLPIYKEFLNIHTSNHFQDEINQINNKDELIEFASSKLKYSQEKIENQISEQEEYQIKSHKSFRDNYIQTTAICSFSQDYDNRLMWSHYAKDYTGFCIGYETTQMKKFLYKVKYKNKIFDISNDIIKIMTQQEDSKFDIKKFKPNQMVIQKDNIWKYEKEWRLINSVTMDNVKDFNEDVKINNGYLYKIVPSIIYLGTRISDDDKKSLLSIAEQQNLEVNQMIMDENKYQLRYETIYKADKGDK